MTDVPAAEQTKPRNARNALVTVESHPLASATMTNIGIALKQGATVEMIREIIALQKMVEDRDAEKAFNTDFADMRSNLPVIIKTSRVKFESKRADVKDGNVDYSYEDMAQIASQIDPVLGAHGFTYRHEIDQPAPGAVKVTCFLMHKLGHTAKAVLQSTVDTSGQKNHLQAIGSATEYLRRYTLKAVLGLAAGKEVDDDAQSASDGRVTIEREAPSQKPRPSGPPRASQQQAEAPPKGPRKIDPLKGEKFSGWALRYIECLKTADSIDDLNAWDRSNNELLDQIYNGARATYDEIKLAYQKHYSVLSAKRRGTMQDPISTGVAPPADKPKYEHPDPEKEYEEFLAWAAKQLREWRDSAALEDFWNGVIEPAMKGAFPHDKDDLLSEYTKAGRRLEGAANG